MPTRILAFAASTRSGSFNQAALDVAAEGARQAGAEVTAIQLKDFSMPLYDQDLETSDGIPESVIALGKLVAEHDALLIASPEYNGFFSPLYKNTLDWLSRLDDSPLSGKTAALLSASPGGFGGIRALPHAKLLLENLGILVLPKSPAIGSAHDSLDSDRSQQSLKSLGKELTTLTQSITS